MRSLSYRGWVVLAFLFAGWLQPLPVETVFAGPTPTSVISSRVAGGPRPLLAEKASEADGAAPTLRQLPGLAPTEPTGIVLARCRREPELFHPPSRGTPRGRALGLPRAPPTAPA